MSFLGGPECSTGANPLAQIQKQTSADTSLQRDRLASRQPNQLNSFRSQPSVPEDAAFQEFAQQGPQLPQTIEGFQVERHFERSAALSWTSEFSQGGPRGLSFAPDAIPTVRQREGPGGFNAHDFAHFQQAHQPGQTASPSVQSPSTFRSTPMYGPGLSMGMGMMQRPMGLGQSLGHAPMQHDYAGKGKGKVQELSDQDWEKQFEELTVQDQLDELDQGAERAMEKELDQIDAAVDFGDFEGVWRGVQRKANADRDILLYSQRNPLHDRNRPSRRRANADMNPLDYGVKRFTKDSFDGPDDKKWDYWRDLLELRSHEPDLMSDGNYLFEDNNLFDNVSNAFEEGQKIMREGGNLSVAALAFEAAVQKDPEFVDAWVALGQAQAQNEKELPAIYAMEKASSLDPDNLEALMGLSVSYTNEAHEWKAYRALHRWVTIKYPQVGDAPPNFDEEGILGFTERQRLLEHVTSLFLEAAQLNPDGVNVDVDVQVGLGVLFYSSEDYDKAVDCFTAALNSARHGAMKRQGEEHLLWNRLGATLANSGRSEEAIEAYSRALELRSNFVRARYNLGVSCINLGVHESAAVHLLGALSMHRVLEAEGRQKAAELMKDGHGNDADARTVDFVVQHQSSNLYDTLRRVFSQLGRRDLAEKVGMDMDLEAFRKEFEF